MNKRLIYFGAFLIIVSVVISFYLSPTNGSMFGLRNVLNQSLAMRANGFFVNSIYMNQSGVIFVAYRASSNINFYLLNSSAFSSLSGYIQRNQSVAAFANALYGKGLVVSEMNSSKGSFPQLRNSSSQPNVTILGNGTYYAVFENRNSMSINLTATAYVITKAQSASYAPTLLLFLVPGIVLFVGFAFIGAGILGWGQKQQKVDVAVEQKEIDELYKNIDTKRRGRNRRKKRREKGR